jgi:hypothetical protein
MEKPKPKERDSRLTFAFADEEEEISGGSTKAKENSPPATTFEDEAPEESAKLQVKKAKPTRKPKAEPAANYVRINVKRKRYAKPKPGAANNKFKRFKKKK